jgi:ArsR family transcriptional regulator
MKTKADLFSADLGELAEAAKALSHPARLKILQVLADHDSCICGDIVDELPLAQATVSRHLKALREADLVTVTTDGPRSCYCLRADTIQSLASQFEHFFDSIQVPSSHR